MTTFQQVLDEALAKQAAPVPTPRATQASTSSLRPATSPSMTLAEHVSTARLTFDARLAAHTAPHN